MICKANDEVKNIFTEQKLKFSGLVFIMEKFIKACK